MDVTGIDEVDELAEKGIVTRVVASEERTKDRGEGKGNGDWEEIAKPAFHQPVDKGIKNNGQRDGVEDAAIDMKVDAKQKRKEIEGERKANGNGKQVKAAEGIRFGKREFPDLPGLLMNGPCLSLSGRGPLNQE